MNKVNKVFVPNKGVHNFQDAERYGELVFVTKGSLSKFAVGTMARAWAKVLKDSTSSDYILLSSLTALCVIGCSIFSEKHKKLNFLLFVDGKYIARSLDFEELKEAFEDEMPELS